MNALQVRIRASKLGYRLAEVQSMHADGTLDSVPGLMLPHLLAAIYDPSQDAGAPGTLQVILQDRHAHLWHPFFQSAAIMRFVGSGSSFCRGALSQWTGIFRCHLCLILQWFPPANQRTRFTQRTARAEDLPAPEPGMRRCRQCLRVKPEGCFGKQAFDAGLAGRFCGPCALVRTVYCVHSMGVVTMLRGHFATLPCMHTLYFALYIYIYIYMGGPCRRGWQVARS